MESMKMYRIGIQSGIQRRARLLKNSVDRNTQGVQAFFKELCDKSNIHGVCYFTQHGLHWSERLWWIIAFIVALCLCGSMIHNIWVQWHESPMQMSFTEKQLSIAAIPFPTVTLCPQIKNLKDKNQWMSITTLFDISSALNSMHNLSDTDAEKLNALAHVCPMLQKFTNFEREFTNESIYETLQWITPQQRYSLVLSLFLRKHANTEESFAPVFTEDGLCFSFNALNSHEIYTDEMAPGMMITKNNKNISDWDYETGYVERSKKPRYPNRVFNSGFGTGIELFLRAYEGDFEYRCNEYHGFNVILTVPGESHTMIRNSFKVPLERDVQIAVKPKWITTSDGLRKYEPHKRQCFFQSERKLRFFRIYTQMNCEDECLANFTKSNCGCVHFSMPRDIKTRICGIASINCYKMAAQILFNRTKSFLTQCNCLPSCTSIEYDYQLDQIKFEQSNARKVSGEKRQQFELLHAKLTVFFENSHVSPIKRIETYTFGDFLAICGGLLGLFLGISALSIIELIYYSTLRLFWTIRRTKFQNIDATSHSKVVKFILNLTVIKKLIRCVQIIWMYLKEFFNNSNIHGVRYFGERRLHFSERIWWLIAVGLSIWLCGSMTRDIWIHWRDNPVSTSFMQKDQPISTIPFPTVTICPNAKVSEGKLDWENDVTMVDIRLSDIKMKRLNTLAHICPILIYSTFAAFESKPYTNDSIYDLIEDMAPKFNETLHNCQWQSKLETCSKLIAPIFTEDGFCFTFNALNSHDIYTDEMAPRMMTVNSKPTKSGWNLENDNENVNYPMHITDSGHQASLDIGLLFNENDTSFACVGLNQGFKIILTPPGDTLKLSRNYFRVQISEDNIITIKPKLLITSEGLRNYAPHQRQCFYQSERKLRFFKIYSKNNCEAECIANITKKECGCVKFSMPRDKNTKICDAAYIECYEMFDETVIAYINDYHDSCNCLPACTSIVYDAYIDRVEYNMTAVRKTRRNNMIDKVQHLAKLSIFFRDPQVQTFERMELYSFGDFMAICGGLLGLFMGISALSIVEIIYYFTLRLFCTILRTKFNNVTVPVQSHRIVVALVRP